MNLARAIAMAGCVLAVSALPASSQTVMERVDLSAVQKIRDEGLNRSKLDDLASYLTDVIGARLTNSPGSRKANEWAAETFRSWGLANVKVEPWDTTFGRGWEIVSYSGRILDPWIKPLDAYPQAWSGSTKGTITCPVVAFEVRDSADLAKYTGKLKGACVLRGAPAVIGPEFEPREDPEAGEKTLREIARVTGGVERTTWNDVFDPRQLAGRQVRDLVLPLALALLLLHVTEIAGRRLLWFNAAQAWFKNVRLPGLRRRGRRVALPASQPTATRDSEQAPQVVASAPSYEAPPKPAVSPLARAKAKARDRIGRS